MDTAVSQPVTFTMSVDDVPEEALSRESFAFLTSAYHDLKIKVSEPLAAAPDRASAAAAILGRQTLILAMRYLWRTMIFLLADRRFHPDSEIKIDARSILKYEARLPLDFQKLAALSVEARQLLPSVPSAIADELRMLHLSSDVFFELLETVFPLREIGKCRMGFSLVMQAIGTSTAAGALANYERRHKTMYRAIANWQENGGTIAPAAVENAVKSMEAKVDEMKSSVDANTRAVWNLNHRKWALDKGGYETFEALKSACYGLQKKQNDPFRYK